MTTCSAATSGSSGGSATPGSTSSSAATSSRSRSRTCPSCCTRPTRRRTRSRRSTSSCAGSATRTSAAPATRSTSTSPRCCSSSTTTFELLAADAGGVPRAHAVCRVSFEDQLHLVDVGHGAPFYHPIPLDSLPLQIPHGDVSYSLDRHASHREAVEVVTLRKSTRVHSYVAKPPPVAPDGFGAAIERTHAPDAPLMRRLKIIRFFASRVLEIDNNRLVTTHHNITTVTPIRDIDELEAIVHEALQLPRMPVREAVDVLRARGVDIFDGATA
ncbi:arylamine N-acetyltransferase [Nannocystis pusilla]|uniref:arylamine N-acetyltransferase n=1 Tax=Nannocystis pusilla TaxID=889268 RepID=UPI003DA39544